MSNMIRRNNLQLPGPPLFFKLWFGFVALMMVSIVGLAAYVLISIVHSGPAGIGNGIGAFIKAVREAST